MEREIFAQYEENQNPEDAVEALDEEVRDVLPHAFRIGRLISSATEVMPPWMMLNGTMKRPQPRARKAQPRTMRKISRISFFSRSLSNFFRLCSAFPSLSV
jgi:hypothetical protein